MIKIPRAMSTQHPDNVSVPFFAESVELGGNDEIEEAYYSFSHLGCDEQMWDCEGKEVDNYVVKKLLTKYDYYFNEKKLGKDVFLTLRVPNPAIEKAEAKILLETLESIPRQFDAANLVYGDGIAPIFEVILPMTTSSKEINYIHSYYTKFVVGKQNTTINGDGVTISDWIGKFNPEKINVIPLFEDQGGMCSAHNVVGEYLEGKNVNYQRVFLARSDPAMNYGLIGAVLLNKIALSNLNTFSNKSGVPIHPIIGVGSVPFRGHLSPTNTSNVVKEYPSVQTFTIQSAFKYDFSPDVVQNGITSLKETKARQPHDVDYNDCGKLISKYSLEFKKQVIGLAPIINSVAKHVPGRRKRKLHIGLFGYSRSVGGVTLPRAITFTSALYSIGLPPELLGLNALNSKELDYVKENYLNFEYDLKFALKYFSAPKEIIPDGLLDAINALGIDYSIDEGHARIANEILSSVKKGNTEHLKEHIIRAAHIRKFLG